jgi:uncharacterized protein (TIGR00251 family)
MTLPRSSCDGLITPTRNGLRVAIRLTPRAKVDRLLAIAAAEGGRVVKASVAAPPEGGRANEALLQLLARAWRLPRRDLSIIAGSTSRNKAVHIDGDPRRLIDRIATEIASLPGW